jgi:integrase/recombinase XerD
MKTGARPYYYKPKQVQRFASHSATAGAPGDTRGLYAAMRRFLEHRVVMGTPAYTLENVERCVREFSDWAEGCGVTHPQQVTRAVLERYQRHLHYRRKKNGEPLSLITQKTKMVPVRALFKWLTRQGEIPANPAADLEMPRYVHRIPRAVLTAEEAERILALPALDTLAGLRDRAIMEVLYATGVRRAELVRLCVDDIDYERALLLVREGKGRRDRLVPMGERAVHWVNCYLHQVRPRLAWDANVRELFLGQEGYPLGQAQLSLRVGTYVRRADIGKSGSCHLWRHTMATLMLEGGAEIRFIQAMLGHSSITSTQIYTFVALGMLARVHASSHPGVALRVHEGMERPQSAPQALAQAEAKACEQNVPECDPEAALWVALEREAIEDREEIGR